MAAPELATIRDVELIRTGRWPAMTGTWDVSAEDLVAAAAAVECPALRRPVLKLGHLDQRFTPHEQMPTFDGTPAVGWVENLRVIDGGHTLVGDFAGMPGWLGGIAASAYPNRSVEAQYQYRCTFGHTHPFAVAAVALLGTAPPSVGALRSLNDIRTLFSPELPVSDAGLVATIAAATGRPVVAESSRPGSDRKLRNYWIRGEGAVKIRWNTDGDFDRCVRELGKHVRDPKGLCAEYHKEATGMWPGDKRNRRNVAATSDGGPMPNPEPTREELVRAAFNQAAPHGQWIVELGADEVIVIDDTDRSLHRIPVTIAGTAVTFGQSQPVRMAYVAAAEAPTAPRTVFASRAESRPEPDATVFDMPDPRPPAEPAAPAAPPEPDEPAEDEPQAPPHQGGASLSTTSGAEPAEITATEPEDSMSLSEFRSRLGLPDDADEATILAALDERLAKPKEPNEPPQPTDPGDPTPTPTQPAPQPEPAREPELVAASRALPQGVVAIEASLLEELRRNATLGAQAAERQRVAERDQFIAAARDDGRIAPARVDHWTKAWEADPDGTRTVLASLEPGLMVPVVAAGHTGTGEEAAVSPHDLSGDEISQWANDLGISAEELTRG